MMKVLLVYEIDAFRRGAARANPPPRLKEPRRRDTCLVPGMPGRVRAFQGWIALSTIDEGPDRTSGYRFVPLTTKSTSRPSQAEQRSRRAQSGMAVSAPYRAT
jgi:hypothetical protein